MQLSQVDNISRISELADYFYKQDDILGMFSNNVFKLLFEVSPIVSWIKDINGEYHSANKAFLKRFEIEDDIKGKTDADLFPKEIAEKIRQNDLMVLKMNKTIELRETVPTPNGIEHKWIVFKFPMELDKTKYVGGFAIKIDCEVADARK